MSGHDDDDNDGECVCVCHAMLCSIFACGTELSGKLVANFIRHEFCVCVFVVIFSLLFFCLVPFQTEWH